MPSVPNCQKSRFRQPSGSLRKWWHAKSATGTHVPETNNRIQLPSENGEVILALKDLIEDTVEKKISSRSKPVFEKRSSRNLQVVRTKRPWSDLVGRGGERRWPCLLVVEKQIFNALLTSPPACGLALAPRGSQGRSDAVFKAGPSCILITSLAVCLCATVPESTGAYGSLHSK